MLHYSPGSCIPHEPCSVQEHRLGSTASAAHLRRALGSRAPCTTVHATASTRDFRAAVVLASGVLQQRELAASSRNVPSSRWVATR